MAFAPGGGRGVGRAIVERLVDRGRVIALDRDADALDWTSDRPTVADSPATPFEKKR